MAAEAADWRGPDPYDGLWWSWPAPMTAGPRRRQVLIQLHARAPLDIRRLYRRSHPRLAKALALFGTARARLAERSGSNEDRSWARAALKALAQDRSAGEAAWGYPFDTQTRWSFYAAGKPNIVVTGFASVALQEAAMTLDEPAFAERAETAARWMLDELYLPNAGFFAYHPDSTTLIHNASLLGARAAWRVLGHDDDAGARRAVESALDRTLVAQRPDGSFPYGEGSNLQFVDSFHTGFVLDCLNELKALDTRIPEALERGTAYYVERFFGDDGAARLWPDRPFPEDAHAAGTALTTLSRLVRGGVAPRELVQRVGRWTSRVLVVDGHATCRRHRRGATSVRYLRWCDAHVAAGLAEAALCLDEPRR